MTAHKPDPAAEAAAAIVDEAIRSRRSVRAFLPDPVDMATVRDILEVSARAPSGTNMQPWRAYVTTGATKQSVTDAILNSGIRAEKAEWDEYKYYPDQFFEPYLSRRREVGFGLYGALGIGRRDVDRMRAQHDRNFTFFDAPVGLLFTIDRRLEMGSWLDFGMFLENIMIAARGRGLARILYDELEETARGAARERLVCEINAVPPNPSSDAFHQRLGFSPVGMRQDAGSGKVVRYWAKTLA